MSNTVSHHWRFLRISALLLALIAGVASSTVFAQDNLTRPTYFMVTGVAENDVLNARADASSSSEIVGSLAHDATPVEVFNQRHNWAEVSLGERMGWVSMHFLEEISLPVVGQTALPEGLTCGGTEPFWGLEIGGGQINYSAIDQPDRTYWLIDSGQTQNRGGSISFVIAQERAEQSDVIGGTTSTGLKWSVVEDEGGSLTAIVSNQMCSDGMSDRDYPRRIDLLLSTPDGTVGQSGCCHIAVSQ